MDASVCWPYAKPFARTKLDESKETIVQYLSFTSNFLATCLPQFIGWNVGMMKRHSSEYLPRLLKREILNKGLIFIIIEYLFLFFLSFICGNKVARRELSERKVKVKWNLIICRKLWRASYEMQEIWKMR